ncbi:MAG: type IV fimbrial biogenesis protein FimT [Glaciecola sp.]|jgi:type IV fimbrial biogenesis protein FimT
MNQYKFNVNSNNYQNSRLRLQGTTLVELMMVVGILAILGTLGVPSFMSIVTKARITSETNKISGLIRYARFTAIEQERSTVICPAADYSKCDDDWNGPKIVFIDSNYNNQREPQEPMLMSLPKNNEANQIFSRNKAIKFYQSGITASPASVRICPSSNDEKYARLLTVSLQGKIKLSRDKNNDGVHENSAGAALSCI